MINRRRIRLKQPDAELSDSLQGFYLSLTRRKLTLRRTFFIFTAVTIYMLGLGIVGVSRVLDELLIPGYRQQPVPAPIFILANPRSGTTFLQRALCQADPKFTTFRTYQVIFPSILLYSIAEAFRRLDPHVGYPARKLRRWVDRVFFGVWKGVHETGLDYPEDEEGMFAYTLYIPGVYLFFPLIDELSEIQNWDDLPESRRRRLIHFYRGSLQRHMYATGEDQTLLIMNVFSIGRVQTFMEAFTEARFIFLVRHPTEALPSIVSFFDVVWRSHSREISPDDQVARRLADIGRDYYRRLNDVQMSDTSRRTHLIRYEDMIADPMGSVRTIYECFGMEWSNPV